MTKVLNVIIVLLAIALFLVVWYPQHKENQPMRLRIACDSSVTSVPVLVAMEESLFIQNRFRPEIVYYRDPDSALAALFAGEIEMGVFPWSTILKRIPLHGETLKVIMAEVARPTLPIDALVRRTTCKLPPAGTPQPTGDALDSLMRLRRIPALTAFRGRTLGYPPQLRDYVPALLAGAGMSMSDIRLVEAPLTALPGMIDNGTVDVAWLLERTIGQTMDYDVCLSYDSLAGALTRYVTSPFPVAAVGISPRFLAKLTRTQRNRLKIALDAAAALTETRQARTKQVMVSYFPSRFDLYEAVNARRLLAERSGDLEQAYRAYRGTLGELSPGGSDLAAKCSTAFAGLQQQFAAFDTITVPQNQLRFSFTLVEASQDLGDLLYRFGRLADTTAPDTALAGGGRSLTSAAEKWLGSSVRLPGVLRLKEIEAADISALASRLLSYGVLADTVRAAGILVEQAQVTR